jgi:hypothetical protein
MPRDQRSLSWRGERPDTAPLAELVRDLAARELATDEQLSSIVPFAYEMSGSAATLDLLRKVSAARPRPGASSLGSVPPSRPADADRSSSTATRALAICVRERARHYRPRRRLLELYERRLSRRAANA